MKSGIDYSADKAIESIEEMARPKCSMEDYLAALKKVQEHIKESIEAAEEDIHRKNSRENDK